MTDHAGYLGIPAASDAGRVVRALQAAKQLRFSEIAQAIRAQHSDALAAIKQLAERGVVQVRHTDGEPVAVLTSKPEEPDDPPKAKPAEEKKKPAPPTEKPKKARSAAAAKPNPPEAPPRTIRNADVFAVLPASENDAMSRGEIANLMGVRKCEIDRLANTLIRLHISGAAKVIRVSRGHYKYYRGRDTLERVTDLTERQQKILAVLPTNEDDGIPLGDVIELAEIKSGEPLPYHAAKWDIEKMIRLGLVGVGPRKSTGPGCPRKYYRIVEGEQEMNAVTSDPIISTLAHDPDVGQPHGKFPNGSGFAALGDDLLACRNLPDGEGYINRQGLKALPVVASELPDDGDIADAVAALADDAQARDLRDESIEDEAPDVLPFEHEWANVSLHELLTEMHKRRARIERDMKTVTAIADATLGMTVMETVDLLDWLSKCLIESHEQNHAKRTAG